MTLLNNAANPLAPQPQRVTGYFELNTTHAGSMFYWFFESRQMQDDDPVVLWIHGGPGCSTALAVFYEHGPFRVTPSLGLAPANYSWDVNHNMIYVDQPMNTGFSYSTDDRDVVYTEAMLAEDMVAFVQEFFQEHPDMQHRDFYLAGVSYAGHMVPNIATAIATAIHNDALGFPMRFMGIALGNPWINPYQQYAAYSAYARMHELITETTARMIDQQGVPACHAAIDTCLARRSAKFCSEQINTCSSNTVTAITTANPGINVYDIRKQCIGSLCYDFGALTRWINQDYVRRVLGARRRRWDGPCSNSAHSALMGDWLYSYDTLLVPLLEAGVRVVIYAGDQDLLCAWPGQVAWLDALQWSGAEGFRAAPVREWVVDGEVAGSVRSWGPLTFIVVSDAGHEVPMDKPKQAWHLYTRFTRNLTMADDSDLDDYWDAAVQRALEPREAVEGADRVPLLNATATNASSVAQLANAG